MLDPKALAAAKEWRGFGTTEQIITAYLSALPQEPSSASMGVVVKDLAVVALNAVNGRWHDFKAQGYDGPISFQGVDFNRLFEAVIEVALNAAPSPSPARGVVEALRQLAYERAKDAYGHEIADALASNGWCWSDTAPDFIDTSLYRAVAALASLSQPAKGKQP